MVCSELIAHRLTKCISLQRPNHHIGRGQNLLILTACILNKEMLSLLFVSHSKKYILCNHFLSLNNFSFMKKPDQDHTTHWEQVKISRKKDEKTVRKPERQKSPRNSNARRHAQITRKSDNQDKVSVPQQSNEKANQRRAAKEKMNDTKSRTADSNPQSLKP